MTIYNVYFHTKSFGECLVECDKRSEIQSCLDNGDYEDLEWSQVIEPATMHIDEVEEEER